MQPVLCWLGVLMLAAAPATAGGSGEKPSPAPGPRVEPAARKALDEMIQACRALSSISLTVTAEVKGPDVAAGPAPTVARLHYQKPGRIAINTRSHAGVTRVTADGTKLYVVDLGQNGSRSGPHE